MSGRAGAAPGGFSRMAPGGPTNPFLGTGARLVHGQAEGGAPGARQPGESFQNPRPSQEGLQPGHREFRGGPVWETHEECTPSLESAGGDEQRSLCLAGPLPGRGRRDGSDPCSARPGATVQFHVSVSSSVKWGAPCPAQSCARIQRLPKVASSGMAVIPQILMWKPNAPMGWSLGRGFGKWRRSDEVTGAAGVLVRDSPRACSHTARGRHRRKPGGGSRQRQGGRGPRAQEGPGRSPATHQSDLGIPFKGKQKVVGRLLTCPQHVQPQSSEWDRGHPKTLPRFRVEKGPRKV